MVVNASVSSMSHYTAAMATKVKGYMLLGATPKTAEKEKIMKGREKEGNARHSLDKIKQSNNPMEIFKETAAEVLLNQTKKKERAEMRE